MGKFSYLHLARKWKIPQSAVFQKRNELGIPPFSRAKEVSPQIVKRLGKQSDRSLAKECGLSYVRLQKERKKLKIPPLKKQKRIVWTAQMLAQLGKISDTGFAKKFGLSISSSWRKRIELNIPGKRRQQLNKS